MLTWSHPRILIIKKDILDLGKGPAQGLDDTTLAAEADYSINFTKQRNKVRSNSYLFVNASEICQFKAKDSKITTHSLCLGNNSKDFSVNNMKETGQNWYVYDFSVDWFSIGVGAIQDVHRYLMTKNETKQIRFIKKMFIELLSVRTIGSFCESLVSNLKRSIQYVSLSNSFISIYY